jgi:glucose-6-phosphate isomerase
MLIALYERAVGLYASLVGINAYHQPGVEAGKKAAGGVIALKLRIAAALKAAPGTGFTAEALAAKLGAPEKTELVFKILEHLAANRHRPARGRTGFTARLDQEPHHRHRNEKPATGP